MNFDLDLGQWIVIALSVFLLIWYFAASWINRKRGTATFRWLYQALEALGEISNAEWIGAANMGARLSVKKATKPFRRVEAHYLLEPREFLPYWLVSRLRGKRDQVIIRMVLRVAPKGRLGIERQVGKRFHQSNDSCQVHPDFRLVDPDLADDQLLDRIKDFLAKNGDTIKSIHVQPDTPHLEIVANIKSLLESPAESYFESWLNPRQDN